MIDSPAHPVPAVQPDTRPVSDSVAVPAIIAPVAGSHHVRDAVAVTITPNDYPRLISLVRALAPETGRARELGDGLQWEHDSGFTSLSLTINPEPTGTVIRADLRADGERVAYAIGVGTTTALATLGALSAHWASGGVIAVATTTLLGGGWLARQLVHYADRRRAVALDYFAGKLAAGLRGDLD